MTNFVTSYNPFTKGVRPRQFLEARVEMLRQEKMLKGAVRKAA